MNIEEGSIVEKDDNPAMWGEVTEIFLATGMLQVKASKESAEQTGVGTFTVHVSRVGPHK